jgi:Mrp family chromosome partitioning ATPase
MKEFIQKAEQQFEIIILDTPPIAIVSDTLTLRDLISAFIFVIRYNYSDKHSVSLINSITQKQIIRNTSVIINDIQLKGYYGNSYKYGYGFGYSYGYQNTYYESQEINPKNILKRYFRLNKK